MSLKVPASLLERVDGGGIVSLEEFLGVVETSLPRFMEVVAEVAGTHRGPVVSVTAFDLPRSWQDGRSEVLRGLASDPIRTALGTKLGRTITFDGFNLMGDVGYFHSRVLELARVSQTGVAIHDKTPPDEKAWRQLLSGAADTNLRDQARRDYGVVIGFRNCHLLAAAYPGVAQTPAFTDLFTPQAQLSAQAPGRVDC